MVWFLVVVLAMFFTCPTLGSLFWVSLAQSRPWPGPLFVCVARYACMIQWGLKQLQKVNED